MTRVKEGLAQLLEDLENSGRGELDAGTMGGYFGERPLTDKQREMVFQTLADSGFSVAAVYSIYKDIDGYRAFMPPPAPEPLDLKAESMRALSIRQPFVESILRGTKNIEYRSWQVKEPGPLLVHASNTRAEPEAFADAGIDSPDALPYGMLVGVVDVVACLQDENGDFEWLLAHPRRFAQSVPYKGASSIFRVPITEVREALKGVT